MDIVQDLKEEFRTQRINVLLIENVSPSRVDSNLFTYKDKVFSAEVSDLRDFRPGRIYPDAADVGFIMVSSKTRSEAIFYLEKEHRDRENDITHWTFKPTTEAIRKNPNLKGTTVEIFND